MDNTAVEYTTKGLRPADSPWTVAGPLKLNANITKGGQDARLEITATSPRAQLSAHGAPKDIKPPQASAVRLVLGTTARLSQPIEAQSFQGRLSAELPELRWVNDILKSEHPFLHGSANADVDLRWSKGEYGGGKVSLTAKEARFALEGNVIQLSGTADAKVTYNGEDKRGQVNELKLHLPLVAVAHEQSWRALPGGLRAQSERLTWQGEPPRRVQGRFTLDAHEVDAFLPFVISSSILRTLAKALVNFGETRAVVELDRTPAALELRLEEARSGELRVYGILRSEKDEKDICGRFYVDDPKFGLGIQLHRGETSIKPFVSAAWWRDSPPVLTCGPDFAKRSPQARPRTATETPRTARIARPRAATRRAR
jgi:hypothetical protein